MKKDYKSIACPECKSTSVDVKTTYRNKHTKDVIYGGEDAVEFYKTSIAEADNVFTITNPFSFRYILISPKYSGIP